MSRILAFFLLACVLMSAWSCGRYAGCTDLLASNFEPNADVDDGSCVYGNSGGGGGGGGGGGSSNLTVYNNQSWVGAITVYVGGTSGSITTTTEATQCGESGCANFYLSAGTYSISATASTGEQWSGNVTVTDGGCVLFELY